MIAVLGRLVLAAASLTLVLGAMEGGARLLGYAPEARTNPMFSWEEKGQLWLMKPGSRWYTTYSRREVRVNAMGLRGPEIGPKRYDRARVLCVGDSVTFGYGVDEEATFVHALNGRQLADTRPIEAVNAAIAGWSARQYRIFLERHGEVLAPDLVLIGIVLNDITELVRGLRELGAEPGLAAANLISSLAESTAFFAALKRFYVQVVDPVAREIGSVEELVRDAGSPAVEHALELHFGELERIVSTARSRRQSVALVLFPFRFQLEEEGLDYPQQRTKAFAKSVGVPVLDVLPALRAYEPARVFVDHDHFTPFGHDIVADEIAEWIESERLLVRETPALLP